MTLEKERKIIEEKLIEELAALEHQQWMEWAKEIIYTEPTLSSERKRQWLQLFCDYKNLQEIEKEKDRRFARIALACVLKNKKITKIRH